MKIEDCLKRDDIDERFGFSRFTGGPKRIGWLLNMHPTMVLENEVLQAACDLYFLEDNGNCFKSTIVYKPFFYILCKGGMEIEVEEYLKRKYKIEVVVEDKEDLQMLNHLSGRLRTCLKLLFDNVSDLMNVRKDMHSAVKKNETSAHSEVYNASLNVQVGEKTAIRKVYCDPCSCIVDVREYDVTYYMRVAMDNDLRVGQWYLIEIDGKETLFTKHDMVLPPDRTILAFDIETTKMPLKFPDAEFDYIMMISYVIDGQGYLITNREIVSANIDDFSYTPKPEFEGPFNIFNEKNECKLLERFFEHIEDIKPHIYTTYNGDFFDWPFIETRAAKYGLDMYEKIGVFKDEEGEYKAYYASHLDCFKWVKRDSYLPAGSHGLKAVTTVKLGYNPIELDPELMVEYAQEQPQKLAEYSVSDAVATYYLYLKYVNPFIFSLSNIIPLNPDDVLRKGSGTLCESLLMVQAHKANILMPNKHVEQDIKFMDNHVVISETYVGGHVEALEAGVFRSDLEYQFDLNAHRIQRLIDEVTLALTFTIQVEHRIDMEDVLNFDEVQHKIVSMLEQLRDAPSFVANAAIYHLDVAAMYPNIILTNRLQPDAMVGEATCASCDFNLPENRCQRNLEWSWRAEYYPATRGDFNMIQSQLRLQPDWYTMPKDKQIEQLNKRLAEYSQKIYKKTKETRIENKTCTVCQRENSFYIDTVRNFRDRRYEYKDQLKHWKSVLSNALKRMDPTAITDAQKMVIVMDSLQLAHKCILNSFYGYVMRKGSRWYSMEMGGIVCLTGAQIIQLAREQVECVGRPLELDTDGIWCMFPSTFPDKFTLRTKTSQFKISYPSTMLNRLISEKFTNNQYQNKIGMTYEICPENSIFFEIDGPYRAMILPASTEEDRLLKKRYAVFNMDGSLAELKGFEVKRRGELKLIKIFQSQIFPEFLIGNSLIECYTHVSTIANTWLDILDTKAEKISTEEIIELIGENKSMSKSLKEYGKQKSTSITCAKRLAEFLGENMVKDKVTCHFIISKKPLGAPTAERAIPVAILNAEESIKKRFLKKWLKSDETEVRDIVDWDYYRDRFASVLQKVISIPATMQNLENPIPRVKPPEWLQKKIAAEKGQRKLTEMFDIEELRGAYAAQQLKPKIARVVHVKKKTDRESVLIELLENMPCPNPFTAYEEWIVHQKLRWEYSRLTKHKKVSEMAYAPFSIQSYFKLSREQAFRRPWHVLEIRSSGNCEVCFVAVEGHIFTFTFSVPRVFYVNSSRLITQDMFNIDGEFKLSIVPKKLPWFDQCDVYRFEMDEEIYQKNKESLMHLLSHSSIQGVYETQTSGTLRAILHLGAQCRVNEAASSTQFSISEIEQLTAGEYLMQPLEYLFLFHLHVHRQTFVVLFPISPNKSAQLYISGVKMQLGNLEPFYAKLRAEVPHLPILTDFDSHLFKTDSLLFAAVSKYLENNHRDCNLPNVLIVQSNRQTKLISVKGINSYPRWNRPCDDVIPPLDWQRHALNAFKTQLCTLHKWVDDMVRISRYSNVPVGNLGTDKFITAIDVMLARKLQAQNHVLWCSEDKRPDLGGRQEDENYTALDLQMVYPEINTPGFYVNVCAEFQMFGLCVAAVVDFVNSELGIMSRFVKDLGIQSCSQPMAEELLVHFYRWLTSSKSLLYDPRILFTVYNHMNKLFMQINTALSDINSTVVYASFNKLIIHTPKTTIESAKPYIKYVCSHLSDQHVFAAITFDLQKVFCNLTWIDVCNYSGFRLEGSALGVSNGSSKTELCMAWNISEYLPIEFKGYLEDFLGEYFIEAVQSTDKKLLLTSTYKQKLVNLVLKMQKLEHGPKRLDWNNPHKQSSRKSDGRQTVQPESISTTPTLEFIKYACTIIEQDPEVADTVRLVRRDILEMIGIREFSKEAAFKNPCYPLILHQMICPTCNYTCDMDLTRSKNFRQKNTEFRCLVCNSLYVRDDIEVRLMEIMENSILSHQIQEIVCDKCGLSKLGNINLHCSCSGAYRLEKDPKTLLIQLQSMKKIAKEHNFVLLTEVVETYLSLF